MCRQGVQTATMVVSRSTVEFRQTRDKTRGRGSLLISFAGNSSAMQPPRWWLTASKPVGRIVSQADGTASSEGRLTVTLMQRLVCALALSCAALTSDADSGEWDSVSFDFTTGEENCVKGPNEAFTSVRPQSGPWTARFGVSNHFANLQGEQIKVFSARTVTFHDYNTVSGHAGKSGHIVFKIQFSEPVSGAIWQIDSHGKNVAPPARLVARYSRDGQNWIDAHIYAPGLAGDYRPPPVTLRLESPTEVLYLGWFAEVPEGTGWWLIGTTGELTLTPADLPLHAVPPESERAKSANEELQGPRVVPRSFFGTTTHVNGEGQVPLLQDLGIHNVRIDMHWAGLEPARGQYNFDPSLWMLASADLGFKHNLDQLVVLTNPPAWSTGERGTYPNDQSTSALEEFMFRLASMYKGKIRYWQAGNEPNMAIWREQFIPFLKAYYRGVKRADPQNKVVLCGFAGVEHLHLDAVYRLGGKEYFDILGAHPYTRPAMPEDGGYLDRIRAIRDVMKKYGDHKPLWVDEIGWNGVESSMLEYLRAKFDGHRNYAVTEEDQARALARVYLLSATVPWIERVYFFHLHQEATYTEISENVDFYMGLFSPWLEKQVRPKDAYFAVKTVIQVLNESSYVGRVDTPSRVWGLHFQRGGEATIALWSLDDGLSMTLKDVSVVKSITSMVGTPQLVKDCLTVSGRPLYLRCDVNDVERLKQQIREASWKIGN